MRLAVTILIASLLLVFGCSSGGIDPDPTMPVTPREITSVNNHECWGLWQFTADPVNETLEPILLRQGSMHLNPLPFLEPPAFVKLTLDSLEFNGNILDADIGLRHPFLGLDEFTGFDVCGIFIADGSVTGFDDAGIVMAGDGDTRLLNPDGLSRWWNPTEFPVNDGSIFSYTDGLLGTPNSIGNFSGTINGYKYFCDQLDSNDSLDAVDPTGRGVFTAGSKNVRHYTIDISGGLVFNYALDACWQPPQGSPPWVVPDDFGQGANRAEAWRVSVTEVTNTLYNDGVSSGGELSLDIDVYDWFNAELNIVIVESPGNFSSVTALTPSGGGVGFSSYTIEVTDATPQASGPMDILISVPCEQQNFEGFISGVSTTAYFLHTATVFVESPECPIPVPSAITGSPHIANGTVDTTITCTNLIGTTGIAAYLDLAGTIDGSYDVTATNITNVDVSGDTFDATFDLTGVTPGYYYVVVTNACGETGASESPLFLMIEYLVGDLYVSNHTDFDGLQELGTMTYPYHTINAAKDAANDDDLILVDYGIGEYHESLSWNPYTGYVTVRAYNWYSPSGRPTLGGSDVTSGGSTVQFFHAWDVTLQGFKIDFIGGTGSWQMMDIIHSHNIVIKDNFFTGDSTYTGGNYAEAIGFHWSYDATIVNCLFKNINAGTSYAGSSYVSNRGINSGWSRNLVIKNCEFTELQTNSVPSGYSLTIDPVNIVFDYGNFQIYNNLIHHIDPTMSGASDGISMRVINNTWPLDNGDPNTGLGYIYNNTIDSISLSGGVNSSSTSAYGIKNLNYTTPGYDIDIHSNILTNITGEASQYIWGIDDMDITDYTNIWQVLRDMTEYPWYNPSHEGVGCIFVDPEFENNTSPPYNYQLQAGSPCEGTGKSGVDMGAYGNLGAGEVIGLLGPED